ncbi:MAG: PINc/VapC family ATPase [Archaeoglobaceae archaeon]
MKKYVVDTSVLIDGRVSQMLVKDQIGGTIIIPESAMAELESQANFGKISGIQGLEEVERIKKLSKEKEFELLYLGDRPTLEQIRMSRGGEIDHLIRKVAESEKAILITSDNVQHHVAVSRGIESLFFKQERVTPEETKIMSFFTSDSTSVHLREGVPPYAKRGELGNLKQVRIREEPMTIEELQQIAHEILEATRQDGDSTIEIERHGATVVQLRDLRIAIAERPFSDRMEITAVRPVAKLTLEEYGVSDELRGRFVERQRGVMISGPPGAGKSTFAASVADFLMDNGFMIKTMESPRDLMVRDDITQYAPLDNDMRLTADLLLLVRPDYTIYDELRRTSDFQVYADMRLAGVGMIGVSHATRAIDAVQRMIGRVELGMIPQVVDTIIFIDAGKLEKVYELNFTVKVPAGMYESDLARPVIEISDFNTKSVEYEVYTFGEQVVVMPVAKEKKDLGPVEKRIEGVIANYASKYEIDVLNERKAVIKVPEEEIPSVVGKKGRTINRIEETLGMSIDIYPLPVQEESKEVEVTETNKHLIIHAEGLEKKKVDVYADGEFLLTASVGGKGQIRVRKETEAGRDLRMALTKGAEVYITY